MPQSSKLYRAFGLIALVFMLQACTCWGIEIGQFFPSGSSSASEETVDFSPSMDCSLLTLTSPLGGLPNGVVTVYWNALEGAVIYRLFLYSGNIVIGNWETAAPATSLQADVSQAAVGGENPFALELIAYDADGNTCVYSVVQNREAAPPQAAPQPTATPTCAENPRASYC